MYKLIRDRIPELIGDDAQFATIESDSLYADALFSKLEEEVEELNRARFVERDRNKEIIYELSDVLEVIDAIKALYKIDDKFLMAKKKEKAEIKGKFEKRYIGFFN